MTGSLDFASRLGIRESLTGRIGVVRLFPLTLAEANQKLFEPERASPLHSLKVRFDTESFAGSFESGGMPVPTFMRDRAQRDIYFQNWLETAVYRDAARAYGRCFDGEFGMLAMQEMGRLMRLGEMISTSTMQLQTRKLAKYLQAFRDIFLLQVVQPCPGSSGKPTFVFCDSGLANYLMGHDLGEGATKSLVRVRLLQELMALHSYQGKTWIPQYYKSPKGLPIDFVWNGVPIKIHTSAKIRSWDLRNLVGAQGALRANRGILVSPVDSLEIPKGTKSAIAHVPWSYWS